MGLLNKIGLNWERRKPASNEWRIEKMDAKEKRRSLTAVILDIQAHVAAAEQFGASAAIYDQSIQRLKTILEDAEERPLVPDVAGNARHWIEEYERRQAIRHH
jgi:hypothetical protein